MKDCTQIIDVRNRWGNPIPWYDDGYGPLWAYRNSLSVVGVVRAQTWHDAYEIVLDEILTPIDDNEVPEAYGFYGPDARRQMEEAEPEDMELQEGYQYQPNSTGTGIVSTDINGDSLDELTSGFWKWLELDIKIAHNHQEIVYCRVCRRPIPTSLLVHYRGRACCRKCFVGRRHVRV